MDCRVFVLLFLFLNLTKDEKKCSNPRCDTYKALQSLTYEAVLYLACRTALAQVTYVLLSGES
jgi:hypothetical protein